MKGELDIREKETYISTGSLVYKKGFFFLMFISKEEAERRVGCKDNLVSIFEREREKSNPPSEESVIENENHDLSDSLVENSSNSNINVPTPEAAVEKDVPTEVNDSSDNSVIPLRPIEPEIVKAHNGNKTNHLNAGRKNGDKDIPDFLRIIAGITSQVDSAPLVAETLGISVSAVHNYKRGRLTNAEDKYSNTELTKAIKGGIEEVHDDALRLTKKMLGLISDEELGSIETVKEKVIVAEKLTNIVDKTRSKESVREEKASFVFFTPERLRVEADYEAVEIRIEN